MNPELEDAIVLLYRAGMNDFTISHVLEMEDYSLDFCAQQSRPRTTPAALLAAARLIDRSYPGRRLLFDAFDAAKSLAGGECSETFRARVLLERSEMCRKFSRTATRLVEIDCNLDLLQLSVATLLSLSSENLTLAEIRWSETIYRPEISALFELQEYFSGDTQLKEIAEILSKTCENHTLESFLLDTALTESLLNQGQRNSEDENQPVAALFDKLNLEPRQSGEEQKADGDCSLVTRELVEPTEADSDSGSAAGSGSGNVGRFSERQGSQEFKNFFPGSGLRGSRPSLSQSRNQRA